MILLRIISVTLVGLSLVAISGYLWIAAAWYCCKKRASMIPLIGGVLGKAGLLLLPVAEIRRFWSAPLIADLGCAPMQVAVAIGQIQKKAHRNHNLN